MVQASADQCIASMLAEAKRLGVEVQWQKQAGPIPEAAYHAYPGRPGMLVLRAAHPDPPTPGLCTLLSHEMVHVLQHWRGQLQGLTPLGWPTIHAQTGRDLSPHEAEAYANQTSPMRVLEALRKLKPPAQGLTPVP